jgi:hypothetical protein
MISKGAYVDKERIAWPVGGWAIEGNKRMKGKSCFSQVFSSFV